MHSPSSWKPQRTRPFTCSPSPPRQYPSPTYRKGSTIVGAWVPSCGGGGSAGGFVSPCLVGARVGELVPFPAKHAHFHHGMATGAPKSNNKMRSYSRDRSMPTSVCACSAIRRTFGRAPPPCCPREAAGGHCVRTGHSPSHIAPKVIVVVVISAPRRANDYAAAVSVRRAATRFCIRQELGHR